MTIEELRTDLRAILAAEEKEHPDWNDVQGRCLRVATTLKAQPLPDFPHDIWHFLADADIRRRDSQYAEEQRRDLRSWLDGSG